MLHKRPGKGELGRRTVFLMAGQEVYSRELAAEGEGEVELSGAAFGAGTYVCHLVVNGKDVDSKKLVLTR